VFRVKEVGSGKKEKERKEKKRKEKKRRGLNLQTIEMIILSLVPPYRGLLYFTIIYLFCILGTCPNYLYQGV